MDIKNKYKLIDRSKKPGRCKINGYPAFGVPAQNSKYVSFGDWAGMAVGQWGPLEIIVDPYSDAKSGLINLTVVGLFDTGCLNPRGLVWNASA